MKRLLLCLAIGTFLSAGVSGELWAEDPYLGIYGDEYHESICALHVELFQIIEVWLWARPGDDGLKCVELSTDVEYGGDIMMWFYPEFHPDIAEQIGTFPDSDLSVCWNSCYTDWVWILKSMLFMQSTEPIYIWIEPMTGQSHPTAQDCNGVEESIVQNTGYYINEYMATYPYCGCIPPYIYDIDLVGNWYTIEVVFQCLAEGDTMVSVDNYSLFEKDNPTNTIPINGITYKEFFWPCSYYRFVLDKPIENFKLYTLHVNYIDGYVDDRDGAEIDFSFSLIATLLQEFKAELKGGGVELSWSMASVDDGVAFAVSRRSSGGEWIELPADAVERADLFFTYLDGGVEPDESYVYRVEYDSEGSRILLFQTEPVTTPAMPLALEQNVPNPFNPVTEIRYYLPEAVDVRLEVYDISGRRVALLADGLQPKGWQAVHWDGTDTGSRSVASGVYFYRLRAGKEVISKKMVLLR